MKKVNVVFHIPSYTTDKEFKPVPLNANYDYWVLIIKDFLLKSKIIEIQCWNDETDLIEELKSLFKEPLQCANEDNLFIIKGKVTSTIEEYLNKKYLNEKGKFKWFTINFYNDNKIVFQSGHWGTEIFIPNIFEEEVSFYSKLTPIDTDLFIY